MSKRTFVAAALVAACSSSTPSEPEAIVRETQPIINGAADTTHAAVVAIALQSGSEGGLCSGTIVKVDPATQVGWVLTAAHCVAITPVLVIQADDFESPTATHYEVIDWAADTRYQQGGAADQPYDVAVIRIAGVTASTPVIPIAGASDGVVTGTSVVSIGYGRTTGPSAGNDTNTIRKKVTVTATEANSAQIAYDMSQRGTCQGDSGGPDLVTSGGVEKVVGIHSYGDSSCASFGVSGRVSGNLGFIAGELAKAAPARDCGLCTKIATSGENECALLNQACFGDPDCKGFYDCLSGCGNTLTCRSTCLKKFPKAEGPATAAAGCACTRACTTECGGDFECKGVPKCGYKFPAGACTTCTEGSCCQESLDCGKDGTCYLCLKNGDADPACATNAARKKLATCVAGKCKDDCSGSGLDTGADPPAETEPAADPADPNAAAPATTTTTSSCSTSPGVSANGGSWLALVALVAATSRLRRRR